MSCWICMPLRRGDERRDCGLREWKRRLPGLWCWPWHFHDDGCLLPSRWSSLFGVRAERLSLLHQHVSSSVKLTRHSAGESERDGHLDTDLFTASVKKQTPLKWGMHQTRLYWYSINILFYEMQDNISNFLVEHSTLIERQSKNSKFKEIIVTFWIQNI